MVFALAYILANIDNCYSVVYTNNLEVYETDLARSLILFTTTCPCNIQLCFKTEHFCYKSFDNFNIFAQNINCGYTLEPPRRGGSNEYPQSVFWSKNNKK